MSKKGEKIKKQIEANNLIISKNMDTKHFILNKKVDKLLKENKRLREKCPHEFDDFNICVFCGYSKEDQ